MKGIQKTRFVLHSYCSYVLRWGKIYGKNDLQLLAKFFFFRFFALCYKNSFKVWNTLSDTQLDCMNHQVTHVDFSNLGTSVNHLLKKILWISKWLQIHLEILWLFNIFYIFLFRYWLFWQSGRRFSNLSPCFNAKYFLKAGDAENVMCEVEIILPQNVLFL